MKCPIPWCGQELPDKVRHETHEQWAKEIAEGRNVFLAIRNPDGSIDVYRWEKK